MNYPSINRQQYDVLFLDRDGVINEKLENDYVKSWDAFLFTDNALNALQQLRRTFKFMFIVTNQQGVGKGIMSLNALNQLHEKLKSELQKAHALPNAIYCATELESSQPVFRKPATGMALQAKLEHPEIEFSKSVMIGDSLSDMQFGNSLNMLCFNIGSTLLPPARCNFKSLDAFSQFWTK